jgi:Co/Zn/Cd efflux system component
MQPVPVIGGTMLVVATAGLIVNAVTPWILRRAAARTQTCARRSST